MDKIKDGLIFIWCEKENLADMIYSFETRDVHYVENFVWVKLVKQEEDLIKEMEDNEGKNDNIDGGIENGN